MTLAPSPDDATLLSRYFKRRDPDAFAELAGRYAALVFSVARRITRSDHDAEDIAQASFLELAKNARTVRSVPAFLHRTATTRALNLRRDNATRLAHESQAPLPAQPTAADITWQELLPRVDAAIDNLPDHLRLPLLLHYQHARTQAQISEELRISQATVSRRLEAAVAQLRAALPLDENAACSAALAAALAHTAPLPSPAHLLPALHKIGLSGIAKPAAATTALTLAKFAIAAILFFSVSVITLILVRHGPAAAPTQSPPPGVPAPTITVAAPPAPGTPVPIASLPLLASWRTPEQFVSSAALSPDGALAVTASNFRVGNNPAGVDAQTSLLLWDTATRQQLREFTGHSRYIAAVAFAPDGNSFASASRDGTARIWDVHTGKELHRFTIENTWITALAFSADGARLLTCGEGVENPGTQDQMYLWDIATGKRLVTFEEPWTSNAVALSPDGNFAALGTNGSRAQIFDAHTGKTIMSARDGGDIHAVAFSPDSSQLLTAGNAELVALWNLRLPVRSRYVHDNLPSPTLLAQFEGHDNPITAVVFTPDGKHALSAGGKENLNGPGQGEVRFWDLATHTQLACSRLPRNAVHSLSLNAAGTRALAAAFDGSVYLYDLTRFNPPVEADQPHKHLVPAFRTFKGPLDSVQLITFSPDGRQLFALGDASTVFLWNTADASEIRHYDFNGCFAAAYLPPDDILGFRSTDLVRIKVRDLGSPQDFNLIRPEESREEINSWNLPTFAHNTRAVLLGKKSIFLCNLTSNHLDRTIPTNDNVECALVSPDESLLLTAEHTNPSRNDFIREYTLDGTLLREFPQKDGNAFPLLFAPDGKSFFHITHWGRNIVQCDTATGEPLQTFTGHQEQVYALAITSDGKILLSSGRDKTLRLWTLNDGAEFQEYDTRRLSISAIAVSPDNSTVATDNPDGTISLWTIPPSTTTP